MTFAMFRIRIAFARAAVAAFLLIAGVSASPAAAAQQLFASPDAAVQSLVEALRSGDANALLAVLGDDAGPLVDSGDAVADKRARQKFVREYDAAHSLVEVDETHRTLQIGADDWPFPIPLAKTEGGWRFDTAAGDDEILARRIGRNELSAIQACLAYGDAQHEYSTRDPAGDGVPQYAQRFTSTPGKRDGLYWETAEGEEPSPLGPLFAEANEIGYDLGKGPGEGGSVPYFGYYYRILTAQGANAAGGAYDYVVGGKMIGGFALIAYPAHYGGSGIMTFLINHDGVVFEKDLGPETDQIAREMKAFDPDGTWARVPHDEEEDTP